MGAYDIYKKHMAIHKQSGSDNYYVSWALDTKQKGKKLKITKTVYNSKGKGKKTPKNFDDVIDGYSVLWYYRVGRTWYPDKSVVFSKSAKDSKSDLYSPSDPAADGIIVKVKPTSKTYTKDKKGNTAHWFSAKYTTKSKSYDGTPSAPSIATFTIKDLKMKVKVAFETGGDVEVDRVQLYAVKDETTTVKLTDWDHMVTSAERSLGYVFFENTLEEVGSYQVQARIASKVKSDSYYKWSPLCGLTSIVDTQPLAPEIIACEAFGDDKIKITWSKIENITKYVIEYVAESEEYFNSGAISSASVSDMNTYILTGLKVGITYYIRVKSTTDTGVDSDPSEVRSAILATKPSPPTTWSSVTVAAITNDISTTDVEYLYWAHNSKDGSAQRSSELRFEIAGKTYYLLISNPNYDEYGNLIDKTMQLPLWTTEAYTTEGSNTGAAGTIYSLFVAGGGSDIKWKVRTKGIHADYSDWSTERSIKAYLKPTLSILMTKDGSPLASDILTGYPFNVTGSTTPTTQNPISFYISIISKETYEDTNEYGDEVTISEETEVFSTYVDKDTLNLDISASDVDLKPGVKYLMSALVYMGSGLSASSSYAFTPEWVETSDIPNADIEYSEKYRYCNIRPYCHYYIGDDSIENDAGVYYGTGITGTSTEETIFPNSGVSTALVGDLYFNHETYTVYMCTLGGDAATAKWIYRTIFDCSESRTWYSGTGITIDYTDIPVPKSEVENAALGDYYFNTDAGDIFRCIKSGKRNEAIWQYVWNIFWQASENTMLSVYRKDQSGSYILIGKDIDNSTQSSDSAIYVKDHHPSFNTCVYRIVATNTVNRGMSYTDIEEENKESSIVIQWDEMWETDTEDPTAEEYRGSILEFPANIKLSDDASPDAVLAEYIGRERPVSYYGTQKGESAKLSCEFPKEDTDTLSTLRKLMAYRGDVYIREPSGLGYWACVNVSYDRNYKELAIPVTLTIKPVEGGA